MKRSGAANYAVSRPGTLVYVPAAGRRRRCGRSCGLTGKGARNRSGRRCAATVSSRVCHPTARAWRLDPRSGERRHLDLGSRAGDAEALDLRSWRRCCVPVWTPDGRRIVFASTARARMNLYIQAADGTGTVERLTTSTNRQCSGVHHAGRDARHRHRDRPAQDAPATSSGFPSTSRACHRRQRRRSSRTPFTRD